MDITSVFATLSSLIAAIPIVTQAIKKFINKEIPRWASQLISWLVGIGLTMFGWFFDLGCLMGASWWQALIVGFGVSLASNGVFDIVFIKQLLELVFGKIKKS